MGLRRAPGEGSWGEGECLALVWPSVSVVFTNWIYSLSGDSVMDKPANTCGDHCPTPTHSRTSSTRIDPDLQHLITAWPDLPGAVRVGITAMVQATTR